LRFGRCADPLYRHYDVHALTPAEAEALWRMLGGEPAVRRPYAALCDGEVVGSLVVRPLEAGVGDIGIILDPRRIGRGLGRRILAAFAEVLLADGFRLLRLDVAGYNARAIAAYRAAGFAAVAERWDEPEPGIHLEALLRGQAGEALAPHVSRSADGRWRMRVVRMERRLDEPTKEDR
jgi:RimJ/RimL family protein N-acetyltransferase